LGQISEPNAHRGNTYGNISQISPAVRRRSSLNAIEDYVKSRLLSVFKGTVLDPFRTHTKQGAPLASLFFAVSNPSPRAVQVASGIARHILGQPARRPKRR